MKSKYLYQRPASTVRTFAKGRNHPVGRLYEFYYKLSDVRCQ